MTGGGVPACAAAFTAASHLARSVSAANFLPSYSLNFASQPRAMCASNRVSGAITASRAGDLLLDGVPTLASHRNARL